MDGLAFYTPWTLARRASRVGVAQDNSLTSAKHFKSFDAFIVDAHVASITMLFTFSGQNSPLFRHELEIDMKIKSQRALEVETRADERTTTGDKCHSFGSHREVKPRQIYPEIGESRPRRVIFGAEPRFYPLTTPVSPPKDARSLPILSISPPRLRPVSSLLTPLRTSKLL